MRRCFICGESNEVCLVEHHLIPRSLGMPSDTVTLCMNCHAKVHRIIKPLVEVVKHILGREGLKLEPSPQEYVTVDDIFEVLDRQRTQKKLVLDTLRRLEKKHNGPVPEGELVEALKGKVDGIEAILRELIQEMGVVYQPRPGYYAVVDVDVDIW